MNESNQGKEVTKDSPCPLCKKPDWCLRLPSGAMVCGRTDTAPPGWQRAKSSAKDGRLIFKPILNHLTSRERPPSPTWERTGKHDRKTKAFEKRIIAQYSPTQRVIRLQWSDRRAVYKNRSGQFKDKYVRPQYLDGNKWKTGKGPDPWPLYHEDDIRPGEAVFFVGGETCVEALRRLGFSATCNQGGEGTYQEAIAQRLKRLAPRSVTIWPDNDPAGQKAAEGLRDSCQGQGIPVAVLDPLTLNPDAPLKWDVADWDISRTEAKTKINAAVSNLTFLSPTAPRRPQKGMPKLAKLYQDIEVVWGSSLRLNELTNQIELSGTVIEEPGDLRLTLALDHGVEVSATDCDSIIKRLARLNRYHPVKEYLEQCEKTHGDSTQILDGFTVRYFGCQAPIYQTFLVKTLVGAVARIFEPGCKVDTALILQGPQGFRKSSFFRTLAGTDWFDDSMGVATQERDERLKLHQFWIIEWGELESILKRKDISAVKAFLSCQVDSVRPPYGRTAISLKRRSIIVGSTNQDDFLNDATGNRRFWIIPVQQRIDIEQLRQERGQIWAAAVALYRSGYPVYLAPEEEEIAARVIDDYRQEDPWLPRIVAYLRDGRIEQVPISELLTTALEIEPSRQRKADEMRVSEILKGLGWTKTRKTVNDIRRWVWVSPKPAEISSPEVGPGNRPFPESSLPHGHTQNPHEMGGSDAVDNLPNQNHQNTYSHHVNGHSSTPVDLAPMSEAESVAPEYEDAKGRAN